jgi:hypothetical protein
MICSPYDVSGNRRSQLAAPGPLRQQGGQCSSSDTRTDDDNDGIAGTQPSEIETHGLALITDVLSRDRAGPQAEGAGIPALVGHDEV